MQTNTQITRPAIVKDEHLNFLDALRLRGETNMFGAGPYLAAEFGLSRAEAYEILSYWMRTFPRTTDASKDIAPEHTTG